MKVGGKRPSSWPTKVPPAVGAFEFSAEALGGRAGDAFSIDAYAAAVGVFRMMLSLRLRKLQHP